MIADIDKMTATPVGLYVLVDVTDGRRDFYVVPGDYLSAGVHERHEEFMASVGGVYLRNPDSWHTTIYSANVEAWRNSWSLFEDVTQPATGDAGS
ncbi:hypothetical protein AB0B85_09340 [Micromonospora sp. NPDC049044]|uniref:hypothetical protein n=1 Tax=Micromonospora sp. NPDC049044 TaxID=3154827 RepID=UPI0033D5148C